MMSRNTITRAYLIYIIGAGALFTPSPWAGQGELSAQSITLGQNTISNIAKSDPLIITGAVGTQNTFYHSSLGNGYRSPLSNSVYANLNISVYGISMPFSFYYSNNNTSWSFPHLSFHIDPTYKNWRGHFGRSNMALSPYLMNMSFNGVGLEYTSSKMRFGAFYGELRKAINDDPTDPKARSPQYSRMGMGFKAGYGSGRNYIDLSLLRAFDKTSSVDPQWQQQIRPLDNIAIALRGGVGVTRWLSLRGNVAWSAISTDKRATEVHTDKLDHWSKVFQARYTSYMRIAADASANLNFRNFSSQIIYKMVQPDYGTLGLYYTSNNYQMLGVNLSTTLFKRVTFSGSFSGQEDNITRNQLFTTRGFVYTASASTNLTDNLSLAAGYNGYLQRQYDGKTHVNDTTRVNRVMHSAYVTPAYTIDGENCAQVYSLTANYTENKDLNPFATGVSDVRTVAVGLSHSLEVKPWEMQFFSSLSHQTSKGYDKRYTSDVLSVGTGRSFLKEKNLYTNVDFQLCYNNIKDMQRVLSLGANISAGYTLAKVHAFTVSAGFNKYSDVNLSNDLESMGTTEIMASLNYNYTFSLLHLKRKAEAKEAKAAKEGKKK